MSSSSVLSSRSPDDPQAWHKLRFKLGRMPGRRPEKKNACSGRQESTLDPMQRIAAERVRRTWSAPSMGYTASIATQGRLEQFGLRQIKSKACSMAGDGPTVVRDACALRVAGLLLWSSLAGSAGLGTSTWSPHGPSTAATCNIPTSPTGEVRGRVPPSRRRASARTGAAVSARSNAWSPPQATVPIGSESRNQEDHEGVSHGLGHAMDPRHVLQPGGPAKTRRQSWTPRRSEIAEMCGAEDERRRSLGGQGRAGVGRS